MQIIPTEIPDVRVLVPRRFDDGRGWFGESYNRRILTESGISFDFVQDNMAYSRQRGVLRGLHYQIAPSEQAKLVSVLRGSILDVAVDIRRDSPTFGRHVCRELSFADGNQLLIPAGFAHGYVTLEPDTTVFYKVTKFYDRPRERGILWSDPDLRIDWRFAPGEIILKDRDRDLPRLRDAADLS